MNAIEKARKTAKELASKYDVAESAIVWMGNGKFIIVKNGEEIVERMYNSHFAEFPNQREGRL